GTPGFTAPLLAAPPRLWAAASLLPSHPAPQAATTQSIRLDRGLMRASFLQPLTGLRRPLDNPHQSGDLQIAIPLFDDPDSARTLKTLAFRPCPVFVNCAKCG